MHRTLLFLAMSPLVTAAAAHAAPPDGPASATVTVTRSDSDRPAKWERGAWLGVTTSKARQAVLDQSKIRSGLVVDMVGPASPAAEAGLKASDVIQKFDDQLLVNPAQFRDLIRLHSPGDSVSLTVLRNGTPTPITVKLVEHDVPPVDDAPDQSDGTRMPVVTASVESTMSDGKYKMSSTQGPDGSRKLTVRDAQGTEVFKGPIDTDDQKAAIPDDIRPLFQQFEKSTIIISASSGSSESSFSDGTHQLSVKQGPDGSKTLTVRDSQGKELFKGPVDTDEQKAAIPDDVQPLFEKMQKMTSGGAGAAAVAVPR